MPKGRGAGRTKKHRRRKPAYMRSRRFKMGSQAGDFAGGGVGSEGLYTQTPSGR